MDSLDLLVVAPHPDDAELFAGGVIAVTSRRRRVGVVDLTRGELATRGTPAIRATETEAASAALGLVGRWNLEAPDGFLGLRDPVATIDRLTELLRSQRPAVVLAPYPHDRHPDHVAASALVERAVFLAGLRQHGAVPGASHRVLALGYYATRGEMPARVVVDTSAEWPRKVAAISSYRSQFGDDPAAPSTLISAPRALRSIEDRDRYHGALIGAEYGEAIWFRGVTGVTDLVEHVEAQSMFQACLFAEQRSGTGRV